MGRDYYIFNNGRLKRKDNTLFFENSEGNKNFLPVEDIEKIHAFGELDLNTKLINFLGSNGIIVNFYNYYGYYTGSFYPREGNVSGYVTVKQASNYSTYERRLYLAKCFVSSSAFHIKRNLRNYEDTEETIENIKREEIGVITANEIDELMGSEGRIRKQYYNAFNIILRNGFTFEKREKRPPTDPVNALISFGNSLMYTTVLSQIYKTQLDPTISFLHEPSTRRFSLSLDISEIFKPLIVDPIIFRSVNNGIITLDDFDIDEGICFLNETGKKKFIKEYEDKLSTTIKHRKLNRKVSYKTFIILECYKLIKHFIDDEIYQPLKAWW